MAGRSWPGYDFVSELEFARDGNGFDSDPTDPGNWLTAADRAGDARQDELMNFDWESLAPGIWRVRLPFLDVTVGVIAGDAGVLMVDAGTTLAEARAGAGTRRGRPRRAA